MAEFGFNAVMGTTRGHKHANVTDDERLWSKTETPGTQALLEKLTRQIESGDLDETLKLLNQSTSINLAKSDDLVSGLAIFPAAEKLFHSLAKLLLPVSEVSAAVYITSLILLGVNGKDVREPIHEWMLETMSKVGLTFIVNECHDQDLTPYMCEAHLYDDSAVGEALGVVFAQMLADHQEEFFARIDLQDASAISQEKLAEALSRFWRWRQNSKDDDLVLLRNSLSPFAVGFSSREEAVTGPRAKGYSPFRS